MSDFFPLIVDGSGTPAIKEIPSGDVLDLTGVTVKAVSVNTTLAVAGASTLTGNTTVGGTLGVTGIVTLTDDLIIGDGKTIGSASDVDAMTIAANGQITLTQTLIGTALDISGDIDVDGTTNLDVVDVDGAANFAADVTLGGDILAADFDVNASGDINLDAGGGDWRLIDDGTTITTISNVSGDLQLLINTQDKDFKFQVNDGGSQLDALVIDASLSGQTIALKSARIGQVAVTSSSNAIAWDACGAANAYHVTTENTTFSAPSNAVEGAIISVEIAQGGTVRTIAWNTVFEFAASTAPTVTATANKTDIFSFRYNGSVWQEIGRVQNLAQT